MNPSPGPEPERERSVLLLSGVNLDLLGTREPHIYGADSLDDHVRRARETAEGLGVEIDHVHSGAEHVLVDAVHRARGARDAIVVNPGAFTHYSWALHDALAAFDGPVVELHLSNPHRREAWRHTSVVSPVADGLVCGLGGFGYQVAVQAAVELLDRSPRAGG